MPSEMSVRRTFRRLSKSLRKLGDYLLRKRCPTSIYDGCSTRNTFWEGKFTGKKDLFLSVNMKNCGRQKVRKHKEIKDSDNIFTLDISAKFDSLNKMETTSSESKEKLERPGKGLVTALAFHTKASSPKYKRQDMPLKMSVRRTFRILSKSLRKLGNYLMRKRYPNMSQLPADFI